MYKNIHWIISCYRIYFNVCCTFINDKQNPICSNLTCTILLDILYLEYNFVILAIAYLPIILCYDHSDYILILINMKYVELYMTQCTKCF